MTSVLDLPADGFDRRQPRYRIFQMEDGSAQWFDVVVQTNAPGRPVGPYVSQALFFYVQVQPWAERFWQALEATGKATIYAPA